MKKHFYILASLAVLSGFSACSDDDEVLAPTVQYIELSETRKTVNIGETWQITGKVTPENAINTTIEWSNLHPEFATIDTEGFITGVAEGKDTVIATVDNVKAICIIRVQTVGVEKVTMNVATKKLSLNDEFQLEATIHPENATVKDLTWTSSADDIVSVDATGKIKALALGTATITAACGDFSATCEVVVLGNEPVMLPAHIDLLQGTTQEIELLLPLRLDGKTVTWTTTDAKVATVAAHVDNSSKATVTFVGHGMVDIIATVEGEQFKCTVNAQTAFINLSSYDKPADVEAAVKALDAQGVKVYKISGDFTKLGKDVSCAPGQVKNIFGETQAEVLDFSEIDVKTMPVINGTKRGIPAKMFNCGSESKPIEIFQSLKEIILPSGVEAIGRYAFQRLGIETLVAPGLSFLDGNSLTYMYNVKTLELSTPDEIVYNDQAFNGFKNSVECNLILHHNNSAIADGNKAFSFKKKTGELVELEWKSITFK